MANLTALYREDATEQEVIDALQALINTGDAWRFEGSVGRAAMAAIEAGQCILGTESHRDYWGNLVPSRFDVKPGTKGSKEYAQRIDSEIVSAEIWAD